MFLTVAKAARTFISRVFAKSGLRSWISFLGLFLFLLPSVYAFEWRPGPATFEIIDHHASVVVDGSEAFLSGDSVEDFLNTVYGRDIDGVDAVVARPDSVLLFRHVELGGLIDIDDWSSLNDDHVMQEITPERLKFLDLSRNMKKDIDSEVADSEEGVNVIGWASQPIMNKERNAIFWAIGSYNSEGELLRIISARAIILGNSAYTSVEWLGDKDSFLGVQETLLPILDYYEFDEGYRYVNRKEVAGSVNLDVGSNDVQQQKPVFEDVNETLDLVSGSSEDLKSDVLKGSMPAGFYSGSLVPASSIFLFELVGKDALSDSKGWLSTRDYSVGSGFNWIVLLVILIIAVGLCAFLVYFVFSRKPKGYKSSSMNRSNNIDTAGRDDFVRSRFLDIAQDGGIEENSEQVPGGFPFYRSEKVDVDTSGQFGGDDSTTRSHASVSDKDSGNRGHAANNNQGRFTQVDPTNVSVSSSQPLSSPQTPLDTTSGDSLVDPGAAGMEGGKKNSDYVDVKDIGRSENFAEGSSVDTANSTTAPKKKSSTSQSGDKASSTQSGGGSSKASSEKEIKPAKTVRRKRIVKKSSPSDTESSTSTGKKKNTKPKN